MGLRGLGTPVVRLICFLALLALPLCACARYLPSSFDLDRAETTLPTVAEPALDFPTAAAHLVRRHPRLVAARAHARAVNLTPGPEPLVFRGRAVDDDVEEVTIETDVLALLGLGPRPKAAALARVIRHRRLQVLHEQARHLFAELAEAFAVERALAAHTSPVPELDLATFEAAGLVSERTRQAANAALAEAEAEAEILALARREATRRIVELTGARPTETPPTILSVEDGWPAIPSAEDRALLLARGDLLSAYGAFHEADRRYSLAVARQIPTLELRLGSLIELDRPLQLLRVRLPLDATDEARAAHAARCAEAETVRALVLEALHDAASKRLLWTEAQARVTSAEASLRAARTLRTAERSRLETTPEAFTTWVIAWGQEVRAARALREARVALAKARVAAARAAGWPTAGQVDAHHRAPQPEEQG